MVLTTATLCCSTIGYSVGLHIWLPAVVLYSSMSRKEKRCRVHSNGDSLLLNTLVICFLPIAIATYLAACWSAISCGREMSKQQLT